MFGEPPRIAARADQKNIEAINSGKYCRECAFSQLCLGANRPGPNSIRKTQQRTSMRHAGETEPVIAICFDLRRSRQVRSVGVFARRHLLVSVRRAERVAAGAHAEIK